MHLAYRETNFCDVTFYTSSSLCYQLLIIRLFSKDLRIYFTTSFCLMKNKDQKNYENIFKELKNNLLKYSGNDAYNPKKFIVILK